MAELEKRQVGVLIPAFNEEKNIGPLVKDLKAFGVEVLVVDDGSTDKTAEEARRAGAHLLRSEKNHGKGASLRLGVDWFLGRGYQALVFMDADGQHDAGELPVFLKALAGGDKVIVGNRMRSPGGMPALRRATNRFLSWILSFTTGQKIPDSQCGYRAVSREVLERIQLDTDRFETESEILLEASRLGYKIISVPVRSMYEGGVSNIRPVRDTFRFLRFLTGYLFRRALQAKKRS